MGSTFNPNILVEKLSKLNSSQASIETLSHWCIFHMNKAKQVVETWDRQFHCSARDRRLAFLYLANDILQNSRRKGLEFVGEFWKVLPGALRDVIDNGDEAGRNAALRLIGIWEERKVFGSRGQILKEDLVRRHLDNNNNRNGKPLGTKSKQPVGTFVDKIVSSYQAVYGGQWDEDVLLRKCRDAVTCIEKGDKEISGDTNSGKQNGTTYAEEAREQKESLRDCIEQLTAIESSRASLVSCLRVALQEQEFKLGQIRNQLQAAHSLSERAGNISGQFLNHDNVQSLAEQSSKDVQIPITPQSFVPESKEQYAPVMYAQQAPYTEKTGHIEEDPRKSAAAAVAAKLTASTSSAQMLSFVLSSLASEGIIGNPAKESSSDHPPEKRPKLDNDQSPMPYIPTQTFELPGSPFPHPESLQHNPTTTSKQLLPNELPPPPSSSSSPLPLQPPMPGLSMAQFIQSTTGAMSNLPYTHIISQQQQTPPLTSYQTVGPSAPPNSYQSFQGTEGNTNFYTQPSVPMTPISRQ